MQLVRDRSIFTIRYPENTMNIRILYCAAALAMAGCTKVADTPVAPTPIEASSQNSFTRFTILSGQHYCDKNTFKQVATAELKFAVRFDSSAIYQTKDNENQYDINKLYGFSDNSAQHHQFSARFGWRWSEGALRLFAYVYNEGKRTSKELCTLALNTEAVCSIAVINNQYVFTVNNTTELLPRKSTTPLATGYLLYPYFGGDEVAPHAISIWIKPL